MERQPQTTWETYLGWVRAEIANIPSCPDRDNKVHELLTAHLNAGALEMISDDINWDEYDELFMNLQAPHSPGSEETPYTR